MAGGLFENLGNILGTIGRGAETGLDVGLTPLAKIIAATHGQDPRTFGANRAARDEEANLRSQQAALVRATAMQDPAARAYLVQNPDIAQKLFALPSVPREQATPETLEAGGYAVPGGPTIGTPPARLGVVPPQVTTAKTLQQKRLESQAQTQSTLGGILQQLLGEVGGGGQAGGGAPAAGGGTVNVGGTPMRPVPSISPSGGMGLSFQQAPPPMKINAPTAKRLGLVSGGNYQGRSVIVTEPETTTQTRYKQEWSGKVDKAAQEVEQAVKGLGDYNFAQAWMRTGKTSLGMADPEWKDFTAKADLLGTALMNVHVGARGSEGMMQHFVDGLIGATHQSPENVLASVKVIRGYLKNLAGGMDGDSALTEAQGGSKGAPGGGGGGVPEGWKIERVR